MSSPNSGASSIFGSISGLVGKFLKSQNGTCSTNNTRKEEPCIVIPEGRVPVLHDKLDEHIGGFSELVKDRHLNEHSWNRLVLIF
jgi:hypothetical protein